MDYHGPGVVYKSLLVNRSPSQTALALKALGEPRRVQLLQLLRRRPRAVGELAAEVEVSQQAVSQHLAVLERAGLVEAHREGTRSVYVVRPAGFAPVEAFLRSFWEPKLAQLKEEVERGR